MSTPDPHDDARRALTELRDELLARNSELSVTSQEPLAYDGNFADSAQVAAELGENQIVIATNEEHLAEIDAALERLAAGTYGTCETCGQPIGEARLEVMPTARFCIAHA